MIADCAVYDNGVRREGECALEEALAAAHASPDTFVWIALNEPTETEFASVIEEFDLHPLAVEDAVHAHQRPKLETYGRTLFIVLKPARYVDPDEVVSLSEIMLFLGGDFLITVQHGKSDVPLEVRRMLEADPARLKCGPLGVLHAIVDRVVDDYALVVRGLNTDIDEIERQVFSDERKNHAERIYRLKSEVLEFRQAVVALDDPVDDLAKGKVRTTDTLLLDYFRDVHDHVLRIAQRVEAIDNLLSSALTANLAQVGVRQNEDMRRISAWVAIVAIPTMIAAIYGMNFEHMPELGWVLGYPLTLLVMATWSVGLYVLFRRRGWL
ncbi:MAG TPA: magnesium and cobalt transport protein CorA [Acidimicrobiales bacterium]|nr:magnesium and cobalt transport protein CorA [Acidimicrobiales bacterium]